MAEYIEREAVLSVLDKRSKFLMDEYGIRDQYANGFDECADKVADFPAADVVPAPVWISVKDGLPEVHIPVLVVTKNGTIGIDETFLRRDHNPSWSGFADSLVTHWLPLPEPPKELQK